MNKFLHALWSDQQAQDIAEYAVMLAVILVLVVGTIRLVGSSLQWRAPSTSDRMRPRPHGIEKRSGASCNVT